MGFERVFAFIFDDVLGALVFWTVIDKFEEGVQMRLGKPKRTLQPGLRFILPFGIDEVLTDNVVPTTTSLDTQSLTTKDGKSIVIEAVLTHKIVDIQKILLEVEDADDALTDSASGYIAEQVTQHTWAQVRKPEFPKSLKPHIQRQARKWGIGVTKVQFSDCALAPSYRLWTNGDL